MPFFPSTRNIGGRFICLLLIGSSLAGCVRDKPPQPQPETPIGASGKRLLIANEGSLGNGNASLSFIDLENDQVYNDVYESSNHRPLGDVFQSMLVVGDDLYLAINNSDKIVVVDKNTFIEKASIPINKPRYMARINDKEVMVTSLFHAEINILDVETFHIKRSIGTDFPSTEGLAVLHDKAFVCNWDTACGYLYEINTATLEIERRIPLAGKAPQQVLIDKHDRLWVLGGNVAFGVPASLTVLDPVSGQLLASYSFRTDADIMKPVWNRGRDTLYYLAVNYNGGTENNGVYRMPIAAGATPTEPLIQAQRLQYFWGLFLDTESNHIYVGDPKGFIQSGSVYRYDLQGELTGTFQVRLGPGCFLQLP